MLSCNIGNYLIKHQSEKYIVIVFNSISILVSYGKKTANTLFVTCMMTIKLSHCK